ncbi:leucine-rich repeat-containing protein 75B [Heteronotia binoei]|uniref:leucine-rich repeat-containing protein 75B n=1 Tax=Heteronotia binoei TaxID=13085 RepID=UPI002930A37A|nr:leucine-rich repeat-containing protein 75B [Heteronotia binoei]
MGSRLSRHSSPEGGPGRPPEGRPGRFPLASLLRGSPKLPGALRTAKAAPYERRVQWIREIQATLTARHRDQALHVLLLLRKDLGLEGTFLSEVLYKKAAFLNLVDPISHDLLMSLARDLQCPKKEYDPWKSADRICRQLIYHLTPHSKWQQHSMPHRKSQASLKNNLQKKLSQDAMDLSGIPLSTRDIHRMAYYLQNNGHSLHTVDLSFTDLNDDKMHLLLPFLWSLPRLTHLSLNGNRLTKATVKELTDAMKDMNQFPCLAWIDLGNNVDVSSMPQPLLVGLRKRLNLQTTLPTIYESLDSDSELSTSPKIGQLEGTEAAAAFQADKAHLKAEEESCIFGQWSCKR